MLSHALPRGVITLVVAFCRSAVNCSDHSPGVSFEISTFVKWSPYPRSSSARAQQINRYIQVSDNITIRDMFMSCKQVAISK